MITRVPRISLKKRNALLECFVTDIPASQAAYYYPKDSKKKVKGMVDVSRSCANRWYRHFRELIYMSLRTAPRFFGVVEMDQTMIGGRGTRRMRETLKRLEHLPHAEYLRRARELRSEHKVEIFGIRQREGSVYTHIIKKADRQTLEPIIRLVVEQGSTIYTDKWRAFNALGLDGYTHLNVNHSEEYVSQQGVHVNGIEQFWSFCKRRLSKFNGLARSTLPLHVKECEWRYNTGRGNLLPALKLLLPPDRPRRRTGKGTSPPPSRRSRKKPSRIRRKARKGSAVSSPRRRAP